jgi:hypothetical protein
VFCVNEAFLAGRAGIVWSEEATQMVCGLKTGGWFGGEERKEDASRRSRSHDCARNVEHSRLDSD